VSCEGECAGQRERAGRTSGVGFSLRIPGEGSMALPGEPACQFLLLVFDVEYLN
jgi:hypothetical protein